ncbi:MAG: hypothetical protein IH624_05175 [Phycisphaerae bacterium]|nr:hypothetical protein [Phycisphaerae bacterium]
MAMRKQDSRIYPILGSILLGHFAYTLGRCLYLGTPETVLWISHVGTFIGGLGACLRNRFLISLALVMCFGHHAFWVFDTFSWWLTGKFAVGATAYLQSYGISGWIQASNHFFTVPALLVLSVRGRGVQRHAWVGAGVLFLLLALISRLLLPPASNVNCVHAPWPGFESFISHFVPLDPVSPASYIFFITAITILGNYLPANVALTFMVSKWNKLVNRG